MNGMRSEVVERIAHRELRNNSSEILRRVAEGESFEITNHGEVVAVLGPPSGRPPLTYRAARIRGRWSELTPAKVDGPSSQEVLDELRADRI
jgi:prevent-host-death family protein